MPNYHCDYCRTDITTQIHIKCAECKDFDLCLQCFSMGVELTPHKNHHAYRVMDHVTTPIFTSDWGADQELLLLEAIEMFGLGNWADVADHIGSKSKIECEDHYHEVYLNSVTAPLPDLSKTLPDPNAPRPKKEERKQGQPYKKQKNKNNKKHQLPLGALVGHLPKRGDFETEYDNDAEEIIADMEFREQDTEWERELKLKVLQIYNSKLDARIERKNFILERGLLEKKDPRRTKEEKEIYANLRVFARFHSQEQHEAFVQGLINEQRLRQQIEMLQQHRLSGIHTLSEGDLYEADRRKRASQSKKTGAYLFDNRLTSFNKTGSRKRKSKDSGGRSSKSRKTGNTFDITQIEGAELLSSNELKLCQELQIIPQHYMVIKEKLIKESFNRGFLQPDQARQLIKIDVHKTDALMDFFVSVGWINNQPLPASSSGAASSSSTGYNYPQQVASSSQR